MVTTPRSPSPMTAQRFPPSSTAARAAVPSRSFAHDGCGAAHTPAVCVGCVASLPTRLQVQDQTVFVWGRCPLPTPAQQHRHDDAGNAKPPLVVDRDINAGRTLGARTVVVMFPAFMLDQSQLQRFMRCMDRETAKARRAVRARARRIRAERHKQQLKEQRRQQRQQAQQDSV